MAIYYHLSNHIYIAQFQNELILLDTKQDRYTICFKEFSDHLLNLLINEKIAPEKISSDLKSLSYSRSEYIQRLIDNHIIEPKENPYPFYIDRKIDSCGVSNVDWSLPLENKRSSLNLEVFKAFATLLKVNFYIKVRGFYSTIELIKKSRRIQSQPIIPQEEKLKHLANIVNKACLFYPIRTKCLEWAITFIILALKKGWKCNLEIGVQNYPFFAHAWVECEGKVVMDSQDLREGLAIILSEPYKKVKI